MIWGKRKGLPLGRPFVSSLTWHLDYSILPNIKRPWRIATAFIITTIAVLSGVMIAGLITSVCAVYQTPDCLSRQFW